MPITNTEALTRVIEHREIFHDEMLALMRRIMSGEMSPVMIAALAMGLRVKKETVGEIAAAALHLEGGEHDVGQHALVGSAAVRLLHVAGVGLLEVAARESLVFER
jgi:anthranilate phosphoribosyltransferase